MYTHACGEAARASGLHNAFARILLPCAIHIYRERARERRRTRCLKNIRGLPYVHVKRRSMPCLCGDEAREYAHPNQRWTFSYLRLTCFGAAVATDLVVNSVSRCISFSDAQGNLEKKRNVHFR